MVQDLELWKFLGNAWMNPKCNLSPNREVGGRLVTSGERCDSGGRDGSGVLRRWRNGAKPGSAGGLQE